MSDMLITLVEIAHLALRRHAEALARQPKRGATAYLRAALRCARQMASQSKHHPDLLASALEIVDRVLRDAQAAEAAIFARGGNSAPYLSVLAAAAALRLTVVEKSPRQTTVEPKPARPEQQAAQPEPSPVAPHLRAASPRPVSPKPAAPQPVARSPHYRKASGVRLAAS